MRIEALREELRQPGARTGVGVWLMPMAYLGREEAIAARLDVQAMDAPQSYLAYLETRSAGASFSGLTQVDGYQKLVAWLHSLAHGQHHRDCLLVHTLDLLLLALEASERDQFWRDALQGLPYPPTKLILAVPEKGTDLFPFPLRRRYPALIAEGPYD
jgi:hypothetical protein